MIQGRRLQHWTCAASDAGLERRRVAAIHRANIFELGESGNGEVRAVRESKDGPAKDGPAKNGPAKFGSAKNGLAKLGSAKNGLAKSGSAKSGLLNSREEDCKRATNPKPVSPEPVSKALPQPRSS